MIIKRKCFVCENFSSSILYIRRSDIFHSHNSKTSEKMSIGRIPEFTIATDNWEIYVERLEHYLIVNKIPEELHVSTLITVVGGECYELLVNLCKPNKPKAKTFQEITSIMRNYLQPSVAAERYKFRQRMQQANETAAQYATALKIMSNRCKFGDWLDESLRDQFIYGITNETIRQQLFTEDNLDFAKACVLAQGVKLTEKAIIEDDILIPNKTKVKERQKATVEEDILIRHRDHNKGQTRQFATWRPEYKFMNLRKCNVCSGNHNTSQCRFADFTCTTCKSQGHLARVCPSRKSENKESDAPVICSSCNGAIEGRIVTALNKKWHPEHFTCNTCKKPIDSAKFHQHDGGVHCVPCFSQHHSPRCHGCGEPITDRVIQALGVSWHANHFVCGGCKNELGGGGFMEQAGRPYCSGCYADKFAARCAGCKKPIVDKAIIALDEKWHRDCFTCNKCRNPVTDSTFSVLDNKPICAKCA